ncbi:MAG: hypothetical protein AAF997_21580 [Myxococcota bacterium]
MRNVATLAVAYTRDIPKRSRRERGTRRKRNLDLRRRALRKIGVGGAGFALGLAGFYALHAWGVTLRGLFVALLALPGAYALVGTLELATGSPFRDLSQRWDELRGWQRGALGTFVVVIALLILGGIMILTDVLPRMLSG